MNYLSRLSKLREKLGNLPFEGLLIDHPANLLYLTGLELSSGKLIISNEDAILIVDGRYLELSSKQNLYPVILQKEGSLPEWVIEKNIRTLGFDQKYTSYQEFLNLNSLAEKFSHFFKIIPSKSIVEDLRLIKDEDEIARLRAAAHLGYEGYELLLSLLKEGVTESELAFELEFFWKKRGGKKLAFDPIIAFGVNSSMPHYRAGKVELKKNEHVLIDIGVVLDHYHSDMTRIIFFEKVNKKILEIYEVVKEAQARALSLCRPGTLIGDLDRAARDYIASKGYGENFTHSLGHGVGLDIHEPPILRGMSPYDSLPLQKGMVITIEPGIYLPSIGGVRLEDTIVIKDKGYENLTNLN